MEANEFLFNLKSAKSRGDKYCMLTRPECVFRIHMKMPHSTSSFAGTTTSR